VASRLRVRLNESSAPKVLLVSLASLGLGSLFLAIENFRLSTLSPIALLDGAEAGTLLSFLIMAGLFVWKRKNLENLRYQTALSVLAGILFSMVLLAQFGLSILPLNAVSYSVYRGLREVCFGFLFFCWARALLRFGAKTTAIAMAFASIVLAVLSSSTILLTAKMAFGVASIMPIVSVICLGCFSIYLKKHPYEPKPEPSLIRNQDAAPHKKTFIVFTIIVPMFCYALIFGNIYFHWAQLQDAGFYSMLIQIGLDCGSALGGLLILLLVRFFWNRNNIEIYKVFLLPIVILALWISSFVSAGWLILYLVLVSIVQKTVFLLILLAPCMIRTNASRLVPWCLAYVAFAAGKSMSHLVTANLFDSWDIVSSMLALGLLVCSMLPTLLTNTRINGAELSQAAVNGIGPGGEIHSKKLHNAAHVLAERFSLTKREEEVLVLLARGRTSVYVAEALVVSPSTAKTYQKNVYAKIQVHSQQELISLIEKAIDEQRATR